MSPPTGTLVEPLATYTETSGGILRAYVAIHDEVLASWSSLFSPLGDSEFASHATELRSLSRKVEDLQRLVAEFQARDPASDTAAHFASEFANYLPARRHAIELLATICLRLDAKSTNARRYSWREYRSDLRV